MRRYLKPLFLICLALIVLGGALAAYRWFRHQVVLVVAVAHADGDDAQLITALNRRLAANASRYRLRTSIIPIPADAMRAVLERKVDLVSIRSDQVPLSGLASTAVLFKEAAVVVAVPQSGITTFAQLKGKTIGVLGTTQPNDPLLLSLLRLQGITEPKIVPVTVATMAAEVQRRAIQAVAYVSPLSGSTFTEIRAMRPLRNMKGAPFLLGLDDAEAVALLDRRYEDFDIPAGAIRLSPPMPTETTSTLATSRHLVGRKSTSSYFVARFLGELFEARRGLIPENPLAVQIGAPDTAQDATIPVHPGAQAYFGEDPPTLYDFIVEWVYMIPVVLGALGTAIVGLYRLIAPPPETIDHKLFEGLRALRADIGTAMPDAAPALAARLDTIMDELTQLAEDDELESEQMVALFIGTDQLDRRIRDLRVRATSVKHQG
jgi:TRAP-type uncharacterized transport system substrate-binding protein